MNTIYSVSDTSLVRSSEAIAVRNSFSFRSLMMRVMLVMAIVVGGKVAWGQTTVTYTIETTSSVTISSGTAPAGSSATYNSTYGTLYQLTANNSMTLTLSNYAGYKITGITLSMKSNSSKGAGNFSMKAGSNTLSSISNAPFNNASWYGSWSTSYVNVTPTMSNANYEIQNNENVVIKIAATANSLYCQSFTITYEPASSTPTHVLSSAVSPDNSGTVALSSTTVAEGSTATATATSNPGYAFDHWSISGTGASLSSTSANQTTVTMGTADATVTATFTAIPRYSVSFYYGTGHSSTTPPTTSLIEAEGGAGITLPSAIAPAGCDPEYTFYGWATLPVTETTTAPTIVGTAGQTYYPSENIDLYAVYRQSTGAEVEKTYGWEPADDGTFWDFNNIDNTDNSISPHGGSKYGKTTVTTTAYIKTVNKIANPISIECYYSKTTNNTNSSSKFSIMVSSNGSSWDEVEAGNTFNNVTQGTWYCLSADLSSYENCYIRVYYSGTTAVRALDDVKIVYDDCTNIYNSSPSCSCHAPTSLSVSSITQNTATISWSAGDSETDWDYYYSTSSTAPTSSTPLEGSVSTNPTANISGLTANRTYYWWVRADCRNGDYSGWVSGGSFNTPNYTLDAESNNDDYGTVSVEGYIITATPAPCYQLAESPSTVTDGTANVSQNGNTFTVIPSSNCRVRINFEHKPNHNVVWNVAGSTRTYTYCEGSTIPIEDVPANPAQGTCDDKKFVGWSSVPVAETDEAPALLSGAGIAGTAVNDDMSYYAVFATEEAGGSEDWRIVSQATPLMAGDKVVIVAKESDVAISTTQRDNNRAEADVTKDDDIIILGENVCIFELRTGVASGQWSFYDEVNDGYIYAASSTSNHLKTESDLDSNGSWTIEISNDNVATIIAQGDNTRNILKYNSTSNPHIFSCYSSGQKDIAIYKKGSGVTYSAYSTSCIPCEADATVSSTALTTSDITTTTATIECAGITDIGGAHCRITSYGFVYGTSTNPTIENEIEEVGTAYTTTGTAFQKEIEGLNPCTTYYVRAYATNGHGTAYGPELSFITNSNPTITSLSALCMKNTGATISIEYTSCTTTSDIFAIAIRKGSNYPVSLGTTNPSDITDNTEFGSGYRFGNPDLYSYVVYKGNTMPSSVTVTGLEAGNTYKLKAYRWIAEENKWTTGTTMNLALPRITSLQRDNDETSETLTWNISGTVCDGGRYVVICKEGNSDITSTCADFTSITANTVFGSGTQTQTGEYVVHSGSETSVSITGLTPGTQYMAAVFYVDAEGNCSPKAQTTFTYSRTTILEPGDLAIVAINNTINGEGNTADEFSFVIFKKITPETSIDMTDNGYGRLYEGLWGTNEGFWRITRKNSSLGAGSVITITETTGSIGYTGNGGVEPDLWNNINIYVNGVLDYDNWEINVDGPLDLNEKDQIWIMQGGEWLRDTDGGKTEHNAYYTGNVLYGYTATGWLNYYGYEGDRIPNTTEHYGTRGSVIFPSRGCFTSSLNISSGIAKFKGPFTSATKREWIIRINDEANWEGYNYTSDYLSSGINYKDNPAGPNGEIGYPLPIIPDEFTKGKWSGKKNSDWCDCANWMSLVVPDENIDVEIPNVGNNTEIEIRSGNVVKCKSLTIGSSGRFRNTQENSILEVEGDITIEANGTFRPSEGNAFEIKLGGNIVSNGVFITNENTSLTLVGEESHSISAPSNGSNLKLKNLTIGQALNNFASDTIELYGNLTDNSSSSNGIELPQSLAFKGGNEQTATATEITNVTMNKSENDLTLSGELTVNEKVKFVKGNIVGNVKFESYAVAEGASTNSYIDGTVTKVASASEFSFPTGSNGVLGKMDVTSLSANTSLNFNFKEGGFSASEMPVWWNQNNICNDNGTNEKFDHVSNMYFWNLGTSSPIEDVSFTVTASEDVHFNDTSINQRDASAIKMAIYDGCWKNIGGTASPENPYNQVSMSNINLTATRAGVGEKTLSFGSIDENTILPIELTSFTATCNGKSSLIEWTTATEKNNDFFVLERSHDAVNFKEIARVAGAGNSIEPIDYAYTDYGARGGDNYYRLVQVDYDGTSTASEIIVANCPAETLGEPDVLAFPNPFDDNLTLHFENFGNMQATVEVYDMLGRMVHTQKVNCSQNDYEVVLRLAGLSDGTYNVRISTADFVINRKVVKE